MAIKGIDQLRILEGKVRPPHTTYVKLVHQCAFMYVQKFQTTYKEFDTTIDNTDPENPTMNNRLANQYRNKMQNMCKTVLTSTDSALMGRIARFNVVLVGKAIQSTTALDALHEVDGDGWESKIFTRMDETFEAMANIKAKEKEAYEEVLEEAKNKN